MAAAEAYFCYKQECSHLLFQGFKKLVDHIRTELIRTIRQIFLLREVGQGVARPIRSQSGYFFSASEEFKCTLLLAFICTRLQWFLGSILQEKERKYILTTV